MTSIVFRTPGLIDILSFTKFGVNSKPNSVNPIGHFGTGLKYAIAVLLRTGARVQLFIGDVEYEFYIKRMAFRGKEFDMILMKKRKGLLSKWTYQELPFTTELGKNWEVWMALRELESNTRDENGETYTSETATTGVGYGNEEHTHFVVTGQAFLDAYNKLDEIFLKPGLELRFNHHLMDVYNRPSEYLYYRGLRVMKLERPSLFTYNFKVQMNLTEDRTIMHGFMVDHYMTSVIATSNDTSYISAILGTDSKTSFEPGLPFDSDGSEKSQEFRQEIARRKSENLYVPPRAVSYYNSYVARVAPREREIAFSLPLSFVKEAIGELEAADVGVYGSLGKMLELLKKAVEKDKEAADMPF